MVSSLSNGEVTFLETYRPFSTRYVELERRGTWLVATYHYEGGRKLTYSRDDITGDVLWEGT